MRLRITSLERGNVQIFTEVCTRFVVRGKLYVTRRHTSTQHTSKQCQQVNFLYTLRIHLLALRAVIAVAYCRPRTLTRRIFVLCGFG